MMHGQRNVKLPFTTALLSHETKKLNLSEGEVTDFTPILLLNYIQHNFMRKYKKDVFSKKKI